MPPRNRTTSYAAERFASPFFVSTPPTDRQQYAGAKRTSEWAEIRIGNIPPLKRNNGRWSLAEIIGATGVQEIEDAGELRFHSLGDSGVALTSVAEHIAELMATNYDPDAGGNNPAFLLHLGDVVYGPFTPDHWEDRFYRPYRSYPGKIIAIAGNHDGNWPPRKPSLEAFMENMCDDVARQPQFSRLIIRNTMTQPGIYWMLDAPFARIVGLYSNIAYSHGYLKGLTDTNHENRAQIDWWKAVVPEIAKAQQTDPKAFIVAVHHPLFSQGSHKGSEDIVSHIFAACEAADLWPHAILSGHTHNYQRYTWRIATRGRTIEVPCLVAGTGGWTPPQPIEPAHKQTCQTGKYSAIYETAIQENGYLTITASARRMAVAFWGMSGSQTPADVMNIDVATRKIT